MLEVTDMTLLADVMFGPVVFLIEYLPYILLGLLLLTVALTGFLVGFLYYKNKKHR